jgi:hypothetical protein
LVRNSQVGQYSQGKAAGLDSVAREISYVPHLKLLEGENVWEGFVGIADFAAALAEIKDPDTRDIVEFLYNSA